MAHKPVAREDFELRAVPEGADPLEDAHTLDDLFPFRGNKPTLWARNNAGATADGSIDDAVDGEVKVQTSPDREVWTDLPGASVTVPKGGRDKLDFETDAKYVRFVLVGDVPNGVRCELTYFHFDPARQADVN